MTEEPPAALPPDAHASSRARRRRFKIAIAVALVVGVPIASVAFLSALKRGRVVAFRVVCESNLRGVWVEMQTYAEDHPGEGYPPLSLLVEDGTLIPVQITCPFSEGEADEFVQVFYPPESELDGRSIVLYEPKSYHYGEGGHVLFGNGHTKFVEGDEYDRLINALPAREP